MFNARTLVLFGEVDAAVRQVDETVALAERLTHPFTQAFACYLGAALAELGDLDAGL